MSEPSVEEILKAKRIVRNNGYSVELPQDKVEQAMNVAKGNGYRVREPLDDLDQAKNIVKNAGYEVVKQNKQPTKTEKPTPAHPSTWDMAAKYL